MPADTILLVCFSNNMAGNITPTTNKTSSGDGDDQRSIMRERNRFKSIELLAKLRTELPDRFESMVKMWLSVYLNASTSISIEEVDSIVSLWRTADHSMTPASKAYRRRAASNRGDSLFGAPLTQEGIAACQQLIDFMMKDDVIRSEGLFRISGCATRKSDLRHRLCQGTLIDFEQEHYTHNDASDVLKNFLAELPDPLLSAVHFPVYVRISDFETTTQQSMKDGEQLTANARRLNIVRLLIQCLPVENRQLLRLLLTLFKRIVEHSEQNKMTAANLGILFVPVLMHPKSGTEANASRLCTSIKSLSILMTMMITHADRIMQPPNALLRDVLTFYNDSGVYDDCLVRTPDSITKRLASPFITPSNIRQAREAAAMNDLEAHTTLSFNDKKLSAQEANADGDYTDRHLTELVMQIHALPDGALKQKCIKQIQKMNREKLGVAEALKQRGGWLYQLKNTVQGMKSGRKLRRKSRSIANLAMAEDDETENHVSIGAADDSHLTPLKRRSSSSTNASDSRTVFVGSSTYLRELQNDNTESLTANTIRSWRMPPLAIDALPEATIDLSMMAIRETPPPLPTVAPPSMLKSGYKLPAFDEHLARRRGRLNDEDDTDLQKLLLSTKETFI